MNLLQCLIYSFSIVLSECFNFTIFEEVNHKCYGGAKCEEFVIEPAQCLKLSWWSDKINSIDTYGNCVVAWDDNNCTGNSMEISPLSHSHNNLRAIHRGSGRWAKHVVSISGCDFEGFLEPKTNLEAKVVEENVITTINPTSLNKINAELNLFSKNKTELTEIQSTNKTYTGNINLDTQSKLGVLVAEILTPALIIGIAVAILIVYFLKKRVLKQRSDSVVAVASFKSVQFVSEDEAESSTEISTPSWSWRQKQLARSGKDVWKGSYGAVYKAIRLNHVQEKPQEFIENDAVVAIKHINMDAMARQHKWERKDFQKEAEIMFRIRHEHVVKIFDCWIEGPGKTYGISKPNPEVYRKLKEANYSATSTQTIGSDYALFLELEFCNGTLEEWLKKNDRIGNRMDDINIPSMFQQIANGLSAVHQLRIIHRDLYPKNILYKEKITGEKIWKISDFGLSKENVTETCNQNLISLGCETYRSPEMIDKKGYNLQTDVFSLGLIYFEVLLPSETTNLCKKRKVFNEIRTLREEKLEIYFNGIPPALRKIGKVVRLMLNSEPSRRPTANNLRFSS